MSNDGLNMIILNYSISDSTAVVHAGTAGLNLTLSKFLLIFKCVLYTNNELQDIDRLMGFCDVH